MVEVSPRLGVRVGVFQFVPSEDELVRTAGERSRIHGIERVIMNVYRHIHDNFDPQDRVQVEVESSDLNLGNVTSALVPVSHADPYFLLDRMEIVIQSNQAVKVDSGDFRIRVTHVPATRGAGYTNQRAAILERFTTLTQEVLLKTRSIHEIDRKLHPFCGVAALLLGKVLADSKGLLNSRSQQAAWRRMNRKRTLRRQCYATVREVGLGDISKGITIEQLKLLANSNLFRSYKIIVYSTDNLTLPLAVENSITGRKGCIMLILDDTHHFALIKKPNAFFGKEGYYCQSCFKFFTGTSATHVCDARLCKQCKSAFCGKSTETELIRCSDCKRGFYGKTCFARHITPDTSPLLRGKYKTVCDSFKACPTCNRDIRPDGTNAYDRSEEGRQHTCFKSKCRECGLIDNMSDHECFIRATNVKNPRFVEKQKRDRGKQWFFDMETMKVWDEKKKAHFFVPNLIVMKSEDGDRYVFRGADALKDFCKFCFASDEALAYKKARQVVWAHNNARFDGMFILQGFCKWMATDPSIIFKGHSPMRIKWRKVEFKDTYLYVMSSLDAWARQFGLKTLKGFFPHDFNLPENQEYVGPLPPEETFSTKFMSEKKYAEFKKWYDEEKQAIESGQKPLWNFKEELLKYCENDVDILMEAWLLYQQKMFDLTGIFPGGIRDVSAASYTNLVWKSTIENGTIGVIPINNYVRNDNQSEVAREWLNYEDMIYQGGEMIYSGKGIGGERRIPLGNSFYKVDGFHEPSNTVFEFTGCFYHGCSSCTRPYSRFPLNNLTYRDLNTRFANTVGYMKNRGFNVVVMWECEWKKLRKEPEVATLLKEIHEFIPDGSPINPQDALYGGRTGASSVYFPGRREKVGKHQISGLDFNSLYPSVNAEEEYPVGHPRVKMGTTDDFDQSIDYYFGLMKCVLLPPPDLFHPVLPFRVPGKGKSQKLVFPLCRTCAINRQRERCQHNERERCLDGTWPTPEIYKALQQGYKFLKISSVWDYCTEDGERKKKRRGLFREFVRKFYELKALASGYPPSCTTPDQKEAFLRSFEKIEGIKLDPSKMEWDPVARAAAKLQLNSLWGKWAQRLDERKTTKIFHDAVTLHRFVNDPRYSDFELHLINAGTGIIKGKIVKELQRPNTKGNRVHAVFTTAWARLRLYNALIILGKRVVYYDTDSIFFRHLIGESFDLPIGDFLGQLAPVFSGKCNVTRTF